MKFNRALRWLLAALLFVSTWAILLERWLWRKIPTQMPAAAVYGILLINVVVMALLVLRPSALGLSKKTDKN